MHDTLNRLQTLTPPSAFSGTGNFGFSYDALSRRMQMTRPNGLKSIYAYDNLSRLLSVLHQRRKPHVEVDVPGHHRVSTLVMAGTPIEVIKKWIGHGSEEMIRRYTHLRPDFMRDELARVPDFAPKNASKIVEMRLPRLPHN